MSYAYAGLPYANLPYAQLYAVASGHTAVSPARQPVGVVYVQSAFPQSVLGGMPYAGMPNPTANAPQFQLHFVSKYTFTCTYTQPCSTRATAMCNVQQGSILVVIAISADNQWLQLHGSNTWIPRSWIQ